MTGAFRSTVLALAASVSADCAWAGGDPFTSETQTIAVEQENVYVSESVGVVRVTIDFAKLLLLERPASTVIIGNTGIAYANLSDDKTLILTGKTAGSTNLIVLDANGGEVANLVLEVVSGGPNFVTVHQGVRRQTFSCGRRCEPILSVGDDPEHFSTTSSQIDARQDFADVNTGGQ